MSDIINTQLSGLNNAQRHLLTSQKPQAVSNEFPVSTSATQEDAPMQINGHLQRPVFDLGPEGPRLSGVAAAAASAESLRDQFIDSGNRLMDAQAGGDIDSLRQLAALLLD
jgi:hypothetical protein